MNANRFARYLCAIALLALAACGGGGDGGTGTPAAVDSGSATITTSGGTVATTSGAAKVVLPAGALTTNTVISITGTATAPANARLLASTAYDFGPTGAFAQPVTITVKYLPTNLPSGALESRLALYTVSGGVWQAVAGSTVDTVAHTVSAPVSHFSTYGVLANSQFAGTYSGTFSGGSSGNWNATVDTAGAISATASGGFVGQGSVSFNGTSNIPLAGTGTSQGFSVTFNGNFALQGNNTTVLANGTWNSSSGQTGSWTGNNGL
jgi:hypothetical protein